MNIRSTSPENAFGRFIVLFALAILSFGTINAVAQTPASLNVARHAHTATVLADGRVLVFGGDAAGATAATAEIVDIAAGTSTPVSLSGVAARSGHTATRLADGRVLIAGGSESGVAVSTSLFIDASGNVSPGPNMSSARSGHTAVYFSGTNNVLFIGGDATGTAEVLSIATSTSQLTPSNLSTPRSGHSSVLMNDGRVLIVGGSGLNTAEIFNGSTFTATGNAMTLARAGALLRTLPDGKVQIIGGNNDGSMEVYDPAIDTIGAYAHVIPSTDFCASLQAGVKASQTRAALFGSGNYGAPFDRTGAAIVELGSQALVIGGSNGGSATTTITSIASSTATVTTDKLDYAPGETANISGTGFGANETINIVIHEDPRPDPAHVERKLTTTSDANGNFTTSYQVEQHDLDLKFILNAKGQTSGINAQTAFTDANPQTIAVVAPTSVTVIQGGTANYGNATLTVGGNANPCTITFGVSPGLPAGANPVFGTNGVTTTGANVVSTFSLTTSPTTPIGTYTFAVTASNSGAGCQGPGATPSNTLTLIVNAATVNTLTTVPNASAVFGVNSVNLTATVSPASGPSVGNGSVTFTVKQGSTVIGSPVIDNSVVAGSASVSYPLPANQAAGTYSIEAAYAAGTGFNSSTGTGQLSIGAASQTINFAALPNKTYGDADFTVSATATSGLAVSLAAAGNCTVTGTTVHITGAGSCEITASQAGDSNYNAATDVKQTFSIGKKTLTVTPDAKEITYGDAEPAFTFQYGGGFVIPETAADINTAPTCGVAGPHANAGTYTITCSGGSDNNYDFTYNTAELKINKKTASVTPDVASKVYGDSDPAFTGTLAGFLAGDGVTATYSRTAGETVNGGPYTISATLSPAGVLGNYAITYNTAIFTITKRNASVTPDAKSKVYGEADPTFTGTLSGFVAGDSVTATYSRVAGETVAGGPYQISATLSPVGVLSNYNVTYNTAILTITPKAASVTPAAASKTYGDADPSFTGTLSGFLSADGVTATYARTAGETVAGSPYTISATLSPAGVLGNYQITYNTATFTINARNASVTPAAATKVYGDSDPSFSGALSGFLAADNVTATYSRTGGESVAGSPYTISATLAPAGVLANYNITYNTAQFTITPRPASVTPNPASKTYGDADPALSGNLAGFLAADGVTATYSRAAGETVLGGPYTISATLAPAGVLGNYNITYNTAAFTINAKAASVTPNAASKTYGDADPAFTGTLAGFLAADNVTATYARNAGETVNGGPYNVSATLSPVGVLSNYAITYNTASFAINPRTLTITANSRTKTYGDVVSFAGTEFSVGAGQLVGTDSVTSVTLTSGGAAANAPVSGSPFTITASNAVGSGLDNYSVGYVAGTLNIDRLTVTVTTDPNQTKVYGEADPTLTYTYLPELVPGDSFQGAQARNAGDDVGSYEITQGSLALNGNYILIFVGGEHFAITKRSASVTPNAASKIYGSPDPVFTGSLVNFVASDNITAAYSRTLGETVNGSPYTISATLSPTAKLGNYNISYNTANFTITKKAASVTPNAASKVYGEADPALTGSYSGFLAADNVTASYSRTVGQTVLGGPYTISATLSPAGVLANYDITYNTANFTITARAATWITNPNSKIFGQADPSPLTTGQAGPFGPGMGFLAADNVTASYSRVAGEAVGSYQISATLTPVGVLSNYNITNAGATFSITAWTLHGFYQPVGIPNTYNILLPPMSGITWNSVKGGQTVPLKFNVFQGTLEKTETSVIKPFTVTEVSCVTAGTIEDEVDFVTTGATELRYSGTPGVDGQFIQNWQTPKTANKCYRTVMTTIDGSVLVAFFKTKK